MKTVILGAGMAGLGAWYADNSAEIYEASDHAGGLCRGFEVNGFYFDQAVHLSFAKDQIVRDIFDKTEQYYHYPIPYSWYKETWVQHPAQNNLYHFSPQFKVAAVKGFIARDGRENVDNFKDWLIGGYGDFFYEHLFKLYNQKYWQTDLEKMGVGWIGNRIYRPDIEEVLYGSYTDKTLNVYYASEMRYPKQGGYYAFIKEIADSAEKQGKLHLRKKATKIDQRAQKIFFADGTEITYDRLISSVPMPEMVEMLENTPSEIRSMAQALEHTGVALVSVGMKKTEFQKFWFYIYDTDILAARAYMPSVKAPANAPEGCSSIQFEIYFSSKDKAPDEQTAVGNTLYALDKLGICDRENVLFTDYRIMPYGNVTLLKSTEESIPEITKWLKGQGILPIGRFGEWKYLWSDQSFLSGYAAGIGKEQP